MIIVPQPIKSEPTVLTVEDHYLQAIQNSGSSPQSFEVHLRKPLPESFDTFKSILSDLSTGVWGLLGEVNRWRSSRTWVDKTPLVSVLLLEAANIQQLYRMWTTYTADGQSLWGWICVHIALWLWLNFYRVMTPNAKYAIWGTALGILLNGLVILTVLFFRYCV